MVTRLYSPLVTPYNRPAQRAGGHGNAPEESVPSATDEPKSPFHQSAMAGGMPDAARQPSAGLQAVQVDRFQKIPVSAVLTDFKNTMTVLGADERTQTEVAAYLSVVAFQSTKERPEVPFIKHSLRTAAGSLDQFISKALGQPSQVVKEWVDALLMQDIDYAAGPTPEEAARLLQPVLKNAPSAEEAPAASGTPPFDGAARQQVKDLVAEAKTHYRSGAYPEADARLTQALDLLNGHEQPAMEGHVWHWRGRVQDKAGRWQEALHHYGQAADRFAEAGLSAKEARSRYAMASILDDQGHLMEAREQYVRVVALDTQAQDTAALVRSLNDLGSAELRLGDPRAAVQRFQEALNAHGQLDPDPLRQSDLCSNLGAAYRVQGDMDAAIQAYRQSLQAAKEGRDRTRYTDSLRHLASLYVETQQTDQAMKVLQRLKSFSQA